MALLHTFLLLGKLRGEGGGGSEPGSASELCSFLCSSVLIPERVERVGTDWTRM